MRALLIGYAFLALAGFSIGNDALYAVFLVTANIWFAAHYLKARR